MQARLGSQQRHQSASPSSWWRIIGLTLFAITGIGALYILARTYTINPGKVVVLTHSRTGEMETLEPGMHVILSPFTQVSSQMPGPDQLVIHPYHNIKARTADGVEISATIELGYKIKDPINTIKGVDGDYIQDLGKAVSSTLSAVIRSEGITYGQLASAKTPQMILDAMSNDDDAASSATLSLEHGSSSAQRESKDSASGLSRRQSQRPVLSAASDLGAMLLEKITELCKAWGIEFQMFQIVDPKATDARVEHHYEESARKVNERSNELIAAKNRKAAILIEADAEAERMKKLATAQRECMSIATAAQVDRINKLKTAEQELSGAQILTLDTQREVATALSNIKGMLAIGSGSMSTPYNLFATQQPIVSATTAPTKGMEHKS